MCKVLTVERAWHPERRSATLEDEVELITPIPPIAVFMEEADVDVRGFARNQSKI